MVNLSDKGLLMFFIRQNIEDPKGRITLEGNQGITLTSDTIVDVTSSNSISHVNELILDSTPLVAFVDYLYDVKNRKIIFFTPLSGSLTYNVYIGKNWVFDDTARKQDLDNNSFPRVSIIYVSRPSIKLGNFESKKLISNRIQLDVWTKKNQTFTINVGDYTSELSEDKLAIQIAENISEVFDSKAREITTNHFIDFVPIEEPKLKDFVEEKGLYNAMFEFFIKSLK